MQYKAHVGRIIFIISKVYNDNNLFVNLQTQITDPDANQRREANQSEVEQGGAAFLTPCPSKRHRTVAEAPAQPTGPDWAGAAEEGDRGEIGLSEKKKVCRIYYNIGKMVSEEGGLRAKNYGWFAANSGGAIRKILPDLCGVGRTAAGKYLKKHRGGEAEFPDRTFIGRR